MTTERYYNLLLDENNFVLDFTSWPTALQYARHLIRQELPPALTNQCYRFIPETGLFELDEDKHALWLAAQESPEGHE